MAAFAAAVMATIIARLAPIFLAAANGNEQAARDTALAALQAYQPETEVELIAAAEIVGFSFHALGALARAVDPDLSINQIIRLRGSAVSLSREAHKARRKLDNLQKLRRQQTAERNDDADMKPQARPATGRPAIDPRSMTAKTAARDPQVTPRRLDVERHPVIPPDPVRNLANTAPFP